jgi:DNA-binding CsgD family transcriptional regulator
MRPPQFSIPGGSEQLFQTLVQLLAIRSPELRPALDAAAMPLLDAVGAEKIDVFLYEPTSATLIAIGTTDTPVAARQKELGLDRQALANGGRVAGVFQTGEPYVNGDVDQDEGELLGIREALNVRSAINVAVDINGERRGVLSAISTQNGKFTRNDVDFLVAVARWIGMVADRAELSEGMAKQAFQQGQRKSAEEVARLTARHREIVGCIAEGLTNEEIAERLVLTNGTVANHVQAILSRLGLRNRTQIATWAVERGFYSSAAGATEQYLPGPPSPDGA